MLIAFRDREREFLDAWDPIRWADDRQPQLRKTRVDAPIGASIGRWDAGICLDCRIESLLPPVGAERQIEVAAVQFQQSPAGECAGGSGLRVVGCVEHSSQRFERRRVGVRAVAERIESRVAVRACKRSVQRRGVQRVGRGGTSVLTRIPNCRRHFPVVVETLLEPTRDVGAPDAIVANLRSQVVVEAVLHKQRCAGRKGNRTRVERVG